MRHAFRTTLLAAALGFAAIGAAQAQSQPRLVIGFAAGGPTDLVARAFAEHLGRATGQTVIVENRPGANALLATEAVAAARPDGQTLLAAATNHTMIPALYAGRMKFDPVKSFRPICTIASSPTVLVVGPGLPVKTLPEFLERVRSKPGGASYGTPGQGSSPHLATEAFRKLTGLSLVHVPYKGAAPAITDLLGGQIDFSMATAGSVLPHLKSGKLHALAVASRERSSLLPNVPTFEEAGLKGFVVDTWYGVLAPAGVPAETVASLERQAVAFAKSPAVRDRLQAVGMEPASLCGDTFAQQIATEIVANTQLAQQLGLKAD
ncbi:tripartite tricarboxylate transporter substrate binding protein [Piscinibacter sakaiensis]|uniref:Putative exported protein n=1 Tax=Piscinibacter sakaiensis TaxID=1547922 RepID=A0A0K8NVA6_PISS1|nr:tripartite tricarboxylate transporter substrate binding protein [Piscinibacter sakaiensis]GAP34327.1 putative exported protein [Piscinibacter sakaiensis]